MDNDDDEEEEEEDDDEDDEDDDCHYDVLNHNFEEGRKKTSLIPMQSGLKKNEAHKLNLTCQG